MNKFKFKKRKLQIASSHFSSVHNKQSNPRFIDTCNKIIRDFYGNKKKYIGILSEYDEVNYYFEEV